MKNITICADDFAYSDPISHGIIQLADQQRINAISCMTTRPLWVQHAPLLQGLSSCKIGLHINLTEEASPQALSTLIIKAYSGILSYQKMYDTILHQLDQFCEHHGALPDFLDGHQHVHQLPVVRRAMIDIYKTHLQEHQPFIRLSANPLSRIVQLPFLVKQAIIYSCGSVGLRRQLKKNNIPYNHSFAGIYPFHTTHYRPLFQRYLAASVDGGLIMCHPGLESNDNDPLSKTRVAEWRYFQSEAFIQDLRSSQCSLSSSVV